MIEEDPPPGVPEWVVTYGDMMSLLLTFFIMLVSLSELKGEKKYQSMVESIMRHMGYMTGPRLTPGDNFAMNSAIQKLQTMGAQVKKGEGKGGVKNPGPVANELRVMKGREGTPISLGGPLVFTPGRAEINPEGVAVISQFALKLAGKPHKIDIRGHTGRTPPPEPSTFEDDYALSYARARAVYDLLAEQGIAKERMRISASADNEPVEAGAESSPKYIDRVEIFVLNAFTREFIGGRSGK